MGQDNLFKRKLSRAFRHAVLAGVGIFAVLPSSAQEIEPVPQTRYSQMLDKIEAEGNAANPAQQIIILDMDEVLLSGLSGELRRPIEQLEKSGATRDGAVISGINLAMPSGKSFHALDQNPQAFLYVAKNGKNVCAIVPDTLDLSGYTRASSFWGRAVQSNVKADSAPEDFFRHVTYHELWHCLDKKFLQQVTAAYKGREADTAAYAVLLHRSELFAEIAATLTLAAKGETGISLQRADMRAWRSYKAGSAFIHGFGGEGGYSKKHDPEYYAGAYYYLTRGTDAALEHAKQTGQDKIRQYSFDDIGRIAAELTEKVALDKSQIIALANFFDKGEAYLKKLRAAPSPQERKNLLFLEDFLARVTLAGERVAVPAAEGFRGARVLPPSVKAVVEDDLQKTFNGEAKPDARQAAIALLDQYRYNLHHAADTKTRQDYEERLAALRLMLGRGNVKNPLR